MPVGWYCNCGARAQTVDAKIPMHPCPDTRGLMVPLVRIGQKSHSIIVEREDYIGKEDVRLDGAGRPTMSVITVRDNGQDCTVYAPTASVSQKGLGR